MALARYRDDALYVENVSLADIAEQYQTPCFVYSKMALSLAYEAYCDALAGHNALICYAVKANSNLAILNLYARLGAGFDIVSGGELARVIAAGGDTQKVVFSGVGKSRDEISMALESGIKCFNVESASELERINHIAGNMSLVAPVSMRVNPDVDAKTHPYISTGLKNSKFGVAYDDARPLYRRASQLKNIRICGIDCHIGSQLLDPAPAADAAKKILTLVDQLLADGVALEHIDIGGGMGIRYKDELDISVAEYLAPLLKHLKGRKEMLLLEPGRSLVGNAGLLLTRVEVIKPGASKNFAVVDAAMNDLMRPALYDAWHDICQVKRHDEEQCHYEVVGPVCESGDFLGHDRSLAIYEDDLLAIMSAGAYGMSMSSNYNSRPRAAEVMVDGDQTFLIRQRESVAELFAGEHRLP